MKILDYERGGYSQNSEDGIIENIEYRGPDYFPVKDDQLRQGLERDAFWSRYIDEIYGE